MGDDNISIRKSAQQRFALQSQQHVQSLFHRQIVAVRLLVLPQLPTLLRVECSALLEPIREQAIWALFEGIDRTLSCAADATSKKPADDYVAIACMQQ
jgi:hypothetical protein